jgi:hypothetical protein
VPCDSCADLDLVDVRGVSGIGELESRSTRVEDRHGAVLPRERAELGQPELVPVKPQRLVVVLGRDDHAELADAHFSRGPAAATAGSTCAANLASKFARNIAASSAAFLS